MIGLSEDQRVRFEHEGYLIIPQLASAELIEQIRELTQKHLEQRVEPLEYEADVHYPGAPETRQEQGGMTVRRLRGAITRDPLFQQWVTSDPVVKCLHQLLGPDVCCPMAHHNCVMTKQPSYSSDTGWHQDIRYWAYSRPELISLWLALGEETPQNGCLQVIPGSHRMSFDPGRYDEAKFLRTDLEENQQLINSAVLCELKPGDALFFHCKLFHAASRNYTQESKLATVMTFRSLDNSPLPGSRSAAEAELLLPRG